MNEKRVNIQKKKSFLALKSAGECFWVFFGPRERVVVSVVDIFTYTSFQQKCFFFFICCKFLSFFIRHINVDSIFCDSFYRGKFPKLFIVRFHSNPRDLKKKLFPNIMNKSFKVINGEIFHHKLQIEFSRFSKAFEKVSRMCKEGFDKNTWIMRKCLKGSKPWNSITQYL